jgi:ATP-dependent Clp protease ATP-binding subunit ClpA
VIQTELKDRLADDVLFGPLAKGGRVRVGVAEGKLSFEVLSARADADQSGALR